MSKKVKPNKAKTRKKIKPKKRAVGRPTKLTKELTAQFKEYLEIGNYIETVCDYLMVSRPTFYNWLAKGKADIEAGNKDTLFSLFFNTIVKARAKAEIRNVKLIHDKAGSDTHYATWWLERTNWKAWGKKEYQAVEEINKEGKEETPGRLSRGDMRLIIYDVRKVLADNEAEEQEALEKLKEGLALDKELKATREANGEEEISEDDFDGLTLEDMNLLICGLDMNIADNEAEEQEALEKLKEGLALDKEHEEELKRENEERIREYKERQAKELKEGKVQ